ncbi:hypothetical protein [Proteus vulgaris]|uniref:hypothetical protein n=1 Tax=Proteus vulgaris TaxID=585 RepID=UPI001FF7F972|nr:hypothetical protein [Proteus vulgaris]
MAGALGRLNIDLTLNTANFTNAINRSQRQTEQFGQSIRVSLQAITVQQERMVSQTAKSSALFAHIASVTAAHYPFIKSLIMLIVGRNYRTA